MDYPTIFPIHETLTHKSPEAVRDIAARNNFTKHSGSSSSEMWYKLCGRGYAIVRIDAVGHLSRQKPCAKQHAIGGIAAGVHGGIPHYHKEWITADLFQAYLREYVPQVVRYNDFGSPETGLMDDGVAKRTHIKR